MKKKVKIECTQKELAEIIRDCQYVKMQSPNSCSGCVFCRLCGDKANIEDIADFKIVKEER